VRGTTDWYFAILFTLSAGRKAGQDRLYRIGLAAPCSEKSTKFAAPRLTGPFSSAGDPTIGVDPHAPMRRSGNTPSRMIDCRIRCECRRAPSCSAVTANIRFSMSVQMALRCDVHSSVPENGKNSPEPRHSNRDDLNDLHRLRRGFVER